MIERKIIENLLNTQFNNLELMVTSHCNYACVYCYMKRFNIKPYSVISKEIITTAIALFKTYRKDKFKISTFGGESLLELDIIKYILEITKNDDQVTFICIPTNGSVASSNYNEIKDLMKNYSKMGLSFSVDGIYAESINRPRIEGPELNYDNLFKLCKEFIEPTGFHPMIYAKTVNTLFDTFKWFIKNINDNEHVENILYFLPVRNPNDWNKENLEVLREQLKKCKSYIKEQNISFKEARFNIFRRCIIPRGLTCSLQTSLHVCWDGNVYPCHRLMYPEFLIGNVADFDNWNFNTFIPFLVYHRNNNMLCQSCSIKNKLSCLGSCLGANYEYWGDPSIHIPSICQLLQVVYEEALDA